MADRTPLRAIDIKATGADPRDCIRNRATTFMCRLYGTLQDVKSTPDKRDPEKLTYTFIGDFRAMNATGKEFESERMYLPSQLRDKMIAELKTAQGNAVDFGFDVFAEEAPKSATGYAFVQRSLIENSVVADRLAVMESKLVDVPLPGSTSAQQTIPMTAPAPAEPVHAETAHAVPANNKKK